VLNFAGYLCDCVMQENVIAPFVLVSFYGMLVEIRLLSRLHVNRHILRGPIILLYTMLCLASNLISAAIELFPLNGPSSLGICRSKEKFAPL